MQLISDVAYSLRTAILRNLSTAALLAAPLTLVATTPSFATAPCNCSCPCASAQCQNQQSQAQQNSAQQMLQAQQPQATQPVQTLPQGALQPPGVVGNGAVVYNPWYPGNVVPFFSAYPFVSTPYLIFDHPIPPPIPAPPPLAAR